MTYKNLAKQQHHSAVQRPKDSRRVVDEWDVSLLGFVRQHCDEELTLQRSDLYQGISSASKYYWKAK